MCLFSVFLEYPPNLGWGNPTLWDHPRGFILWLLLSFCSCLQDSFWVWCLLERRCASFPQRVWRSWWNRKAFRMESMHLSITPAPRGNTASPLGGHHIQKRWVSSRNCVFSRGLLSPGQACGAHFPGCRREGSCSCQKLFFFEQYTVIWPVLKCSRKSLWFPSLPCFKSKEVFKAVGRTSQRNSDTEQMGCVSIALI